MQLDELYAVLSALKEGTVSEEGAIERLSRSPHWVWAALDPESKLLLTLDVGERSGAMAQRMVHQVVQVLAPGCVPLFLTDGFKEYGIALQAHFGAWVQPPRRQATGAAPKPCWMPRPQLLYAQVVKTVRRRRLVSVKHRVVFGTLEAVEQVLSTCGWKINTAFIELPRSKLRGIKPPLADSYGPASLAGDYSCSVWMSCRRTLEQPHLLPHILADDGFIPMTAYRTDEVAFGPQLTTPQTLFDGRDAVKELAGRETFDDLDNLGRTVARHRLHQKMDMIFVGANL